MGSVLKFAYFRDQWELEGVSLVRFLQGQVQSPFEVIRDEQVRRVHMDDEILCYFSLKDDEGQHRSRVESSLLKGDFIRSTSEPQG